MRSKVANNKVGADLFQPWNFKTVWGRDWPSQRHSPDKGKQGRGGAKRRKLTEKHSARSAIADLEEDPGKAQNKKPCKEECTVGRGELRKPKECKAMPAILEREQELGSADAMCVVHVRGVAGNRQ